MGAPAATNCGPEVGPRGWLAQTPTISARFCRSPAVPHIPKEAPSISSIRPAGWTPGSSVGYKEARLLENGDAIFPEVLASIASVRQSTQLKISIFDHGAIATRLADASTGR
jgi:hypothetical protein